MDLYGIIGYPLSHSFSPAYFNEKFLREGIDAQYLSLPLKSIQELPRIIAQYGGLKGLNVTIPYKQSVIGLLDGIDETVLAVGAVNTVVVREGATKGFNTDVQGFLASLRPLLRPWHDKALVLGTGGAARAVTYVLRMLQIPYLQVSRSPRVQCLTYPQLDAHLIGQYRLIINTTPLGMSPEVHSCPDLPYAALSPRHLLYDLVYNPEETLFLQQGKRYGAMVKNGHEMLLLQAEAAWTIWNSAQAAGF